MLSSSLPVRNWRRDVPPPDRRWLWLAVDRLQTAAGRLLVIDRTELRDFLFALSNSLPEPTNSDDRLILQLLLLQFAAESAKAIHARVHAVCGTKRCAFIPCQLLEILWKSRTRDPPAAFRIWIDAYFDELNEVHPMLPANKVALFLREHFQRQWDLAGLAERVHSTKAQITRGFRREYGMSIGEYQRGVRLFHAFDRVRRGEKIDAVSLDVGYRSKKNFYRAFKLNVPTAARNPTDRLRSDRDPAMKRPK